MPTKTQTTTTHYHIQKKRRKEFIEEWRNYRQSVIRKDDVKLEKTALYDLKSDVTEKSDVAEKNPEIVASLSAFADKTRADLGDALRNEKGAWAREPGRAE